MLRFRPRRAAPAPPPPDLLAVGHLIDELMQPGHFFVAPALRLHWTAATAEEVPWEIFRGRLLDLAQTRRRGRFLAWHVTEADADTPLLSVRLDVDAGAVHVTRGILCHVWEGYDSGGGVILSREVQRWTTELVGSAELHRFSDADELRDELACLIWQAIVGTSRLPVHSVEAPLPAFSFGQLHYIYRPWAKEVGAPIGSWQVLLDEGMRAELSRRERARVLEAVLRHIDTEEIAAAVRRFLSCPEQAMRLLWAAFNEVSLSPYTSFVDNALAFLRGLGLPLWEFDLVHFLSRLLCQLGRHLTAYDLVTFHHRGANYPDALLLDAVLAEYLALIEYVPQFFLGEKDDIHHRRRALRQACLLRRHYEGHLVPDEPTSPGENARVLSAPHTRVPDEQLLNPYHRSHRLFTADPLCGRLSPFARRLLRESLYDLHGDAESAELGIGLFIDRPLGYAKEAGEPDLTPLLAHEAFSPSIARQRLKELARLAAELALDLPSDFAETAERALQEAPVRGLSAEQLAAPARPVAALADVRRVADDFVIVRTLPGGLRELLGCFDFAALQTRFDLPCLRPGQLPCVVANVQTARGAVLGFFDGDYRCVLEAVVDTAAGYVRRAGVELPAAGLRIVAVHGEDVHAVGIRVPRTSQTP